MSAIRNTELIRLGRKALPLMTPNARAEAGRIIAQMEGAENNSPLHAAQAAFESDMKPVCSAIVSALQAGDMEAMKGLRAMLPHLLAEVTEAPALADALASQIGKALVRGLVSKPADSTGDSNFSKNL